MQEKLAKWLEEKELNFIAELKVIKIGIKRIPDFLVLMPGYGLINIEAKCNNFDEMMKQLNDNAIFCNYSFAYIPDYSLTPKWFKVALLNSGYGLMVFNYKNDVITEVFEAHLNKGTDKELQKFMIYKMNEYLIKRKKAKEVDTQQILQLNGTDY
jgi:hypothetical protein